jgi:hypothetical protein
MMVTGGCSRIRPARFPRSSRRSSRQSQSLPVQHFRVVRPIEPNGASIERCCKTSGGLRTKDNASTPTDASHPAMQWPEGTNAAQRSAKGR